MEIKSIIFFLLIGLSVNAQVVCNMCSDQGSEIVLVSVNNGGVAPFDWELIDGGTVISSGSSSANPVSVVIPNPGVSTTYDIKITDATGCEQIGMTDIIVRDPVTITCEASVGGQAFQVEADCTIEICTEGTAATLTNGTNIVYTGSNDGLEDATIRVQEIYAQYNWTWPDGSTTQGRSVTGVIPGVYTVSVEDEFGCQSSQEYTVVEENRPTLQFDISGADCVGSALLGEIQAYEIFTTGASVVWTHNGSSDFLQPNLEPGTYTVIATGPSGCESIYQVSVGTDTPPVIDPIDDIEVCGNPSTLTFDWRANSGPGTYKVFCGGQVAASSTYVSAVNSVTVTINNPMNAGYTLEVTDSGGCVGFETFNYTASGGFVLTLECANGN